MFYRITITDPDRKPTRSFHFDASPSDAYAILNQMATETPIGHRIDLTDWSGEVVTDGRCYGGYTGPG